MEWLEIHLPTFVWIVIQRLPLAAMTQTDAEKVFPSDVQPTHGKDTEEDKQRHHPHKSLSNETSIDSAGLTSTPPLLPSEANLVP